MNLWDKVTGADIKRECKSLEQRAKKLPSDYEAAWNNIKENLWQYSDFTGGNLIPIFTNVLDLLEESVAEGLEINEVLGDDIKGFCAALLGEDNANTYRDKWRKQLNNNIARKLKDI